MKITKINTIWFFRSAIVLVALSYFFQPSIIHAFSESSVPQWLATGAIEEPTEEYTVEVVNETPVVDIKTVNSYVSTFIISAYYSPIPGQNKYVTGSYSGDIRLNGGGVRGADGTPVYAGMIAAPKSYPFGTKMEIPGLGIVAVHDRGGAIVTSGARGNAHDRLDVWMGYGDEGLTRALKWGKRTVDVTVYGIDDSIKEHVALADYSEQEKIAAEEQRKGGISSTSTAQPSFKPLFSSQLTLGSTGDDVKKLQELLKNSKLYNGEVNGVFDKMTKEAVTQLQIKEGIVSSGTAYGSGYVGPQTMRLLAALPIQPKTANAKSDAIDTINYFENDLEIGDAGDEVIKLQAELKKVNLLGIEPTGYYGEVTEHAVFKFQQIHKLAGDTTSMGAGIFGPVTRTKLNEIVRARLKIEQLLIEKTQISDLQ